MALIFFCIPNVSDVEVAEKGNWTHRDAYQNRRASNCVKTRLS